MASDGTYIYFFTTAPTTGTNGDGALERVHRCGGARLRVADSFYVTAFTSLGFDAKRVFWSSVGHIYSTSR